MRNAAGFLWRCAELIGVFIFSANPTIMAKILLSLFALLVSPLVRAQGDTLTSITAAEDIYCVYQIDKMWFDTRSAYKRDVTGQVNFFHMEDGQITVLSRAGRSNYAFKGIIDSVVANIANEVPVLEIYVTSTLDPVVRTIHVFEISQQDDGTIQIHTYPRRSMGDRYFLVHPATETELKGIQQYLVENTPRY